MPAISKGKHIGRNRIVTGTNNEAEDPDKLCKGCNSRCSNARLRGNNLRCFSMCDRKRGGINERYDG